MNLNTHSSLICVLTPAITSLCLVMWPFEARPHTFPESQDIQIPSVNTTVNAIMKSMDNEEEK